MSKSHSAEEEASTSTEKVTFNLKKWVTCTGLSDTFIQECKWDLWFINENWSVHGKKSYF